MKKCIEKNDYNSFLEKDLLYLVHSSNYLLNNMEQYGSKLRFFDETNYETFFYNMDMQFSLHMYTNSLVRPHGLNNWELHEYAIILNAKQMRLYLRNAQWDDTIADYDVDLTKVEFYIVCPEENKNRMVDILKKNNIYYDNVVSYNKIPDHILANPENYTGNDNNIFNTEKQNENDIGIYNSAFFSKYKVETHDRRTLYLNRNNVHNYRLLRDGVETGLNLITSKKKIPRISEFHTKENVVFLYTYNNDTCYYDSNNLVRVEGITNIDSGKKISNTELAEGDGNFLDEGRRNLVNLLKKIKKGEQIYSLIQDIYYSDTEDKMIETINKSATSLSTTEASGKLVQPIEFLLHQFLKNLTSNNRYYNFNYDNFPLYELIQAHIMSIFYNYLWKQKITMLKQSLINIIPNIAELYIDSLNDGFTYDSDTEFIEAMLTRYNTMRVRITNLVILQKGGEYRIKYLTYKKKYELLKKMKK